MAAPAQPYDDRDGYIWYDGALVPWREAKAHVLTHALHYASSVFEGMRAYDGRIFKLSVHNQRLLDSARELGFEVPYSVPELDAACRETMRANGLEDAYVRPIAWRGSEQMGVAAQHSRIHVAIATWAWGTYYSREALMEGIALQWSDWARPDPRTAPAHSKAAGLYMICTMAKHKAEAAGFHDALMLDWRGRVAEATGANIFLVIDGVLHTPEADCFLDGITRRTVMALAREHGYDVVERAVWPEDLDRAQEVFLTGTAAEVTPVGRIGERTYTPGTVCTTLMDAYSRAVRQPDVEAAPADAA